MCWYHFSKDYVLLIFNVTAVIIPLLKVAFCLEVTSLVRGGEMCVRRLSWFLWYIYFATPTHHSLHPIINEPNFTLGYCCSIN